MPTLKEKETLSKIYPHFLSLCLVQKKKIYLSFLDQAPFCEGWVHRKANN